MQRTDAIKLCIQLLNHWGIEPAQNRQIAWCETLEPLDDRLVRITAANLKTIGVDKPPTPATFVAAYQAQVRRLQPATCNRCSSSGWVTSPAMFHPDHWPGHPDTAPPSWSYQDKNGKTVAGCDCGVAMPCPECAAGNDAKVSHERIHKRRAQSLQR